jgi:glutathione S-transferase
MYHYTAIVTCLAIAFYFFTSVAVARARDRYGIKAPAISGNADFERVFRIQMNTLEWLPMFLVSLWLFALAWGSDLVAAGIGAVWILGRILYLTGYSRAAEARGPGFGIQALATGVLLFGALGKLVWMLFQPGG